MQPEQAVFLLKTVLPTFEREHATTKRIFETIPVGQQDYRPDPVSKTALDLAWHVATTEDRFMRGIIDGEFRFTGASARPEGVQDAADVARWYAKTFENNANELRQLSGDQLIKIIDFRGMLQLPAIAYLTLCMNHSVHHRGQLSTYLRPMGAACPTIYGESYADTQARLAAQAKTN
jgi:uncharacterized damage-inducible protein DinB